MTYDILSLQIHCSCKAVTLFVGIQSGTETPTRLSVISPVPTLYELIGQQANRTN
jgi:hypothetical protein